MKYSNEYSKNARAATIVGFREKGQTDMGWPGRDGINYRCPVCKEEGVILGLLQWSEYNGFIWCARCNKDYPTILCITDIDKAIDKYLDYIAAIKKDSIKNHLA